jgi:hypothetical protein
VTYYRETEHSLLRNLIERDATQEEDPYVKEASPHSPRSEQKSSYASARSMGSDGLGSPPEPSLTGDSYQWMMSSKESAKRMVPSSLELNIGI